MPHSTRGSASRGSAAWCRSRGRRSTTRAEAPPFPAPIAMTFLTPGIGARPARGATADLTLAVISTATLETPPRAETTACAWSRISSLTGHAGVVSSIVNDTLPSSIARPLTKPRPTMSRPRSGSVTALSASRTAVSETGGIEWTLLNRKPGSRHAANSRGLRGLLGLELLARLSPAGGRNRAAAPTLRRKRNPP